ncbi:effector-associated constant component EACC1 [Streptomyces europaeiscabiei]|uniref:effector-associated constant component EACC1 n=1 Tax=Streptomyces europaeiscabiei TaxID=146819 RepID=UPI0029A3CD4A|nr:hypothetical protein [Streptomyces europaeiscabiei]MDX3775958.1 hypothetical protein [Streptomyces europaeiscabiei]
MEFLIEHMTDDSDDLRDLRAELDAEPSVEGLKEVSSDVAEGALGGELIGLLVQVAPEAFTALASVLASWVHARRSRLRLSLTQQADGTVEMIVDSHNNHQGAAEAIEAFVDAARKATGTEATSPTGGDAA